MGYGKPKAGFRKTIRWYERNGLPVPEQLIQRAIARGDFRALPKGANLTPMVKTKTNNDTDLLPSWVDETVEISAEKTETEIETDEQIKERINERFEILSDLTDGVINGDVRSLIVSGPAGLGKSFLIEQKLLEQSGGSDNNDYFFSITKGTVRATGLFKLLHRYKDEGQVLVLDDADTVFFDDTSLNILKAVCDTNDRRCVSWHSEAVLIDDETNEELPKSFVFNGAVVFITNYDFDHMIEKQHRLAPHMQALISRSHYVDLAMKSRRDCLIRIKQVIEEGMLNKYHLTNCEVNEVVQFLEDNLNKLREVSLRTALKVAALRKQKSAKWKNIAKITICKA